MATITQAIASLEQQLRELASEDGTHVFEHVYAYAISPTDMGTPCATILAETTKQVRVTVYEYVLDREQAEKTILAIADACSKRWDMPGSFGWLTHTSGTYRTFSFALACE